MQNSGTMTPTKHVIVGNIVCHYKDKIDRAYAGIYLDGSAGDIYIKNNAV